MNEQLGDYKYMANLIETQANRIREQQDHIDALLKLLEVYRKAFDYIDDVDPTNELNLAEKIYEQTIKR